ncbi:MAG: hypothetical protein LCH88_20985 [Proteobacteria bacterium]|nr:hypothetical protein [Pseudomonadota bacterium]
MIRQFAAGLVAAAALFAVEAATHEAQAQQRRRAVPEVRVSRPNWLVTPKAEFPGNRNSMRPDIIYGPYSTTSDLSFLSTSMRGPAGPDRFWGAPAWTVQWPWAGSFYAGN